MGKVSTLRIKASIFFFSFHFSKCCTTFIFVKTMKLIEISIKRMKKAKATFKVHSSSTAHFSYSNFDSSFIPIAWAYARTNQPNWYCAVYCLLLSVCGITQSQPFVRSFARFVRLHRHTCTQASTWVRMHTCTQSQSMAFSMWKRKGKEM